jgi:hypothetical protein
MAHLTLPPLHCQYSYYSPSGAFKVGGCENPAVFALHFAGHGILPIHGLTGRVRIRGSIVALQGPDIMDGKCLRRPCDCTKIRPLGAFLIWACLAVVNPRRDTLGPLRAVLGMRLFQPMFCSVPSSIPPRHQDFHDPGGRFQTFKEGPFTARQRFEIDVKFLGMSSQTSSRRDIGH